MAKSKPALQAQVLIEFDHGQASLVFAGHTLFGQRDTSFVVGSKGTLASAGPDLTHQDVTLATQRGIASPKLKGTWFIEGFQGTMGELLSAIESRRTPSNNAADNLRSLALCFAAAASADRHVPMVPGKVKRMR